MNYLEKINASYASFVKEQDGMNDSKLDFLALSVFGLTTVDPDSSDIVVTGYLRLLKAVTTETTEDFYNHANTTYIFIINSEFFKDKVYWDIAPENTYWDKDMGDFSLWTCSLGTFGNSEEVEFTRDEWINYVNAVFEFSEIDTLVNDGNTLKYNLRSTGSNETETELHNFLSKVSNIDDSLHRNLFTNEYMFKVMTEGRNQAGDRYEGSSAPDDTGGFFRVENDWVFLTDKAKSYIRVQ